MPLQTGPNSIRANVTELMGKVLSPARKKAISTIARKNNISLSDAKFQQAITIAKRLAQK